MPPKTIDRAEYRRQKEENAKKEKAQQQKLVKAANAVFKSPNGIFLGKWLMEQTGYLESDLSLNPQGADDLATFYSIGRRSVMVDIVKLLRSDAKIKLIV